MTLAAFANIAEMVAAIAVVASLIFVGVQLRQHTVQLQRGERNATNAEASTIRQALLMNAELAEIVHAGINETRVLTPVELDRFNIFLWEIGYLAIQFWDRTRHGLFLREEEFEKIMQSLAPYLTSKLGRIWWQTARKIFRSDFVADFERVLPGLMLPLASPTEAATA